jgi:tetratricopeptide (TPR) repeat protein
MTRRGRKSDDSDDEDDRQRKPVVSNITDETVKISCLVAEASCLMRMNRNLEAEVLYNEALALQPQNLHLLLCRAKCRALSENHEGAIKDADGCLNIDPRNATAILCKANALFAHGNFEDAMVWFYRGSRMRPGEAAFTLGITRSQMAIEKALKCFDPENLRIWNQDKNARKAQKKPEVNIHTVHMDHNLLEELFDDYLFLQDLQRDEVFIAAGHGTVRALVSDGLRYLDNRIDYWRARNPRGYPGFT